jgi:hypothetical protein
MPSLTAQPARTPRARRLLRGVVAGATGQRVHGAVLLLGGVLLALGSAWHAERTAVAPTHGVYSCGPAPSRQSKEHHARTDRGALIPLLAVNPDEPKPVADEAGLFAGKAHKGQFSRIRTGPPGGPNCHGWVYAGGRFLIMSEHVEVILRDNGYQPVAAPQAGDLAIFRDESGGVCHSAVVRGVYETGLVLLESKWGHLGRYLHTPEGYAYSDSWRYYRSPRRGHLLAGLGASRDEEGSADEGCCEE